VDKHLSCTSLLTKGDLKKSGDLQGIGSGERTVEKKKLKKKEGLSEGSGVGNRVKSMQPKERKVMRVKLPMNGGEKKAMRAGKKGK